MTPPDTDPRDAEFIDTICSSVTGMIWAVHRGDGPAVMGHVCMLVNTIIEKDAALRAEQPEGPYDAALRRAVAALL